MDDTQETPITPFTIEQRRAWADYLRGLRRRLSTREGRDVIQREVAKEAGMHIIMFGSIERGPYENARFFELARLLRYYRERIGDPSITPNHLASLVGLYEEPLNQDEIEEAAEAGDLYREFAKLPPNKRKALIPIFRAIIQGAMEEEK